MSIRTEATSTPKSDVITLKDSTQLNNNKPPTTTNTTNIILPINNTNNKIFSPETMMIGPKMNNNNIQEKQTGLIVTHSFLIGCSSIMGAREYQEDKFLMFPHDNIANKNSKKNAGDISINNTANAGFYSIHDGHSGIDAVKKLNDFIQHKWREFAKQMKDVPEDVTKDDNVFVLSDLYYEAISMLAREKSGVVSISAVVHDNVVYFVWVGDCEGCVFRNNLIHVNPVLECDACEEIDMAELFLMDYQDKLPGSFPHRRNFASTLPHAFSGEPVLMLSDLQNAGSHHNHSHNHTNNVDVTTQHAVPAHTTEQFVSMNSVTPLYFRNWASQREYELARRQLNSEPTIDVTLLKIGNIQITADTRFTNAIQPTRSMGDFSVRNKAVIRHPTILRVPLTVPSTDPLFITLCSDGALSNNAFGSISKLSRFMVAPLRFISESFYSRDQELTERLIAIGKLPSFLKNTFLAEQEPTNHHLLKVWSGCSNTWKDFVNFLQTTHLPEIESEAFGKTFIPEAGTLASHHQWLVACRESVHFLSTLEMEPSIANCHKNGGSLDMVANAAAHMAVVMGSQDNITVMVVKI